MPRDEANYRIEEALRRMSIREKVRILTGTTSLLKLGFDFLVLKRYNRTPYPAGGSRRFGLPALRFCDGPRGVVSGHSTCFPVSMARGASWDPELEERIGEAVGREIRAQGGNYYGGVCVNLLRHPAWGRAQETYAEDPHLLGEMGAALVRGVQRHNVMACVKHYAANSMENARFKVDVIMAERTLREVYLPHFRRCIDAGAASVMGAYNKFRGDHCCENEYLLTRVLREEWGFRGFTLSDFVWGVRDGVKALKAGMDVEMPMGKRFAAIPAAVQEGTIDPETVDTAVRRTASTILRFETAADPEEYPRSVIACGPHRTLAREAAERSMVLLKNRDGFLPLDRERIGTLAVIGRLAAVPNTGDRGSSHVRPPYVVTPLAGLETYDGRDFSVVYSDGSDIEEACRTAEDADAVVAVVGLDYSDEGEYLTSGSTIGGDRESLGLRPEEAELISRVGSRTDRLIVVILAGSAVLTRDWEESAVSILYAWYPGMEGGNALSRILFGDCCPGGRLPFTIPESPDRLPYFDRDADSIEYGYYHGYTLMDKEGRVPAYPFGFGLSYTTFSYSDLEVQYSDASPESHDNATEAGSKPHATSTGGIEVTVTVKNTGKRAGAEVVQVYIGPPGVEVDRPKKILGGFRKVEISPGERVEVMLFVPAETLRYFEPESGEWRVESGSYRVYVGSSSRDSDLQSSVVAVP